jgi:hypothetical protein
MQCSWSPEKPSKAQAYDITDRRAAISLPVVDDDGGRQRPSERHEVLHIVALVWAARLAEQPPPHLQGCDKTCDTCCCHCPSVLPVIRFQCFALYCSQAHTARRMHGGTDAAHENVALTTWPLSSKSSNGSAYLAKLAVNTTTSKAAPTAAMKASMCGRFNTYTSTTCVSDVCKPHKVVK